MNTDTLRWVAEWLAAIVLVTLFVAVELALAEVIKLALARLFG